MRYLGYNSYKIALLKLIVFYDEVTLWCWDLNINYPSLSVFLMKPIIENLRQDSYKMLFLSLTTLIDDVISRYLLSLELRH